MGLFGSSGIRGRYGERVTADLAARAGAALGARRRRVTLGWDVRTTSPLLAAAAAAGALSVGAHVERVGMVPTPTLAFAARDRDAGLMVTASHNPAADNGLKFWNPDGSPFGAEEERDLEAGLASPPGPIEWRGVGRLTVRTDAEERHRAAIRDEVGDMPGFAVAVDPGGGAASRFAPALFQRLGARVTALHASPDPRLAARDPEPSPASLGLLADAVRASGSRLGLAHDGDADRVAVLDERGAWVPAEHVLVVLARHAQARRLAVPVNASRVVRDALPGVELVYTRVGDVHVSAAVKRHGLDLGGEPSGTYVLPRWSHGPDGPFVAALLASLVAEAGTFGDLLGDVPRYVTVSRKVPCRDGSKEEAVRRAVAELRSLDADVNVLDGARADFDDGWLLVRASGTEPVLRVTAESAEEARARSLLERGTTVAAAAVRAAGGAG